MAIRYHERGMELAFFISELFVRVLVGFLGALVGVYALRLIWNMAGQRFAKSPDYAERSAEILSAYRMKKAASGIERAVEHDEKDS